MMDQQQRRLFVIAILVLGLTLIVTVLWFLLRGAVPEPVSDYEITDIPVQELIDDAPTPAPIVTPAASAASVVARNVAERFATYSTDAPYQNYEEIKELVTSEYYAALQANRTVADGEGYRGVTARALSVRPAAGDESLGYLEYDVTMQLETSVTDRSRPDVSYRHLFVTVRQLGGAWFVTNLEWDS